MVQRKFYADSRAIIGLQGQPLVFGELRQPDLSIALVESVHPGIISFDACLQKHLKFREKALSNLYAFEVKSASDLPNGKQGLDCTGLVFGLPHAPNDLTREKVRELFRNGVRFMGIAHEARSALYGDGLRGDGSLTQRGIEVIRLLGEEGIILDLSHSNHNTVTTALALISRRGLPTRVMASHSGCYSIHHHPGNLTGVLIRQIKLLDGYLGIPARTYLISEKNGPYLERFVEHVEFAMSVCGDSSIIGIGSDCNHCDMTKTQADTHFKKAIKPRMTHDSDEYWPDRPYDLIEHGSRMFSIFEERLLKKHSSVAVDGICGQNLHKFLVRALPR